MTPLQQLFELPQLNPPRGMQPLMTHRQTLPEPHVSVGVELQQGVLPLQLDCRISTRKTPNQATSRSSND